MFHYHKETNDFSQEASSLRGNVAIMGQLYDDAADIGFVLVSEHTGQEVPFCMYQEMKSEEGEILWWKFKSTSPHKLLEDMTVTVYND